MMIKLYREMKDWDVDLISKPSYIGEHINFYFEKGDKRHCAHIADFETMKKDPELVETILISELHDFLHRCFGIK